MKKSMFLRYCQTSATGDEAPSLRVVVDFAYRSLDKIVSLHGSWSDSSITDVELYRPTPARQHLNYKERDSKLEKERAKYQRWLEEHLAEER